MKYLLKNYYLFTLLFILPFTLFSQSDILMLMDATGECGTEPTVPAKIYTQSEIDNAKYSLTETNYVLNVFVHYIDNIIPEEQQELSTLDIVGTLNMAYNDANIFFKYQGYENIPDSSLLTLSASNITSVANDYANNTRIDIFVCEQIGSGTTTGITWTWTSNATGEITRKVIAIKSDKIPLLDNPTPTNNELKKQTTTHEVGHYLGLHHPHQRWKYEGSDLIKVSDNAIDCDALEENLDGSQWDILGDFVEDTNPDRVRQQYWGNNPNYYSDCTISWTFYNDSSCGNSIDQTLFAPSMDNVMAYYHSCRTDLSSNQKDRSRAFIADESSGGFLTNHLNTVESIYEPYETTEEPAVNYIAYVDASVLEVGDAYYWIHLKHFGNKFQKGFDYEFYNWDIDDDTYDYSVSAQVHENYLYDFGSAAVEIQQLDNSIIVFDDRQSPIPGPTVVSTTVISSEINYNNATTKELNEEESYASDLYQNLENEKLHTIIKHLSNGENDTKVIYKTQD